MVVCAEQLTSSVALLTVRVLSGQVEHSLESELSENAPFKGLHISEQQVVLRRLMDLVSCPRLPGCQTHRFDLLLRCRCRGKGAREGGAVM